MNLITSDLEQVFNSLRAGKTIPEPPPIPLPPAGAGGWLPPPFPSTLGSARMGMSTGSPMVKMGSTNVMYGQPMFFSPIHTPINWQIPSKRKETYQWLVVDGEVLTEDFTYRNIAELDVRGDIFEDALTGGIVVENVKMDPLFSGNGKLVVPPKFSERSCTDKPAFEFSATGYWRKFSVSEEHGVYALDGELYRKKKKVEAQAEYRRGKGIEPNGVAKVKLPSDLIARKEAKDVVIGDYLLTPIVSSELKPKTDSHLSLSYLSGLIAADGCLSTAGARIICNKNDAHIAYLDSIVKSAFGNDCRAIARPHESSEESVRVFLQGQSSHIALQISRFVTGKRRNKKFTKEVFTLSREEMLNVIGGYFDGDGSFNALHSNLIANNSSESMADQLWHMLLKCDIPASVVKIKRCDEDLHINGVKVKDAGEWVYRITVPSSAVPVLAPYMKSGKVPTDFVAKEERQLRFFYEEGGVKFLAQPISEIRQFLHTGLGWDMQIDPDKSYVLSGYKVSNCRYFYLSEPKVAASIDFYAQFPINKFTNELADKRIKREFDKLVDRLKLVKWMRIMSHEAHLLGDVFPFLEIECTICGGNGKNPQTGEVCLHEGGSFKRLIVLNPDNVELYSSPLMPDPIIALLPDEELRKVVTSRGPGFDKLAPEARKMISAGKPIPLDNRNVSHIKFCESGYSRFGTSMIRRLFPTLAYKTKLMTAQWIVAERLILPIKVVKIGSAERPASSHDIANVQAQIAVTANDPNLTLVTPHDFELDWFGASGKVLTLGPEFELIAQEILDGMMINKALLNGEGPQYANASIGIEAMIQRLDQWRSELAEWIEHKIYLPFAMMKGFIKKNAWGEEEYVYPRVKWERMALRDQQNYRQFMLQLHEKGNISTETLLQAFDINYDHEVEKIRFERAINAAAGGAMGGAAAAGPGGMGGGFGGAPGGGGGAPGGPGAGGPPGMGGPEMGGGGMPPMGGDMGGGGGMMGGAPAPAGPMASSENNSLYVESQAANPGQFGGKVLTEKTREKMERQQQKVTKQHEKIQEQQQGEAGAQRDQLGRIMLTKIERELFKALMQERQKGTLHHPIQPQCEVWYGQQPYSLDFAFPDLLLGVEADGETWHAQDDQLERDQRRDANLAQLGWTILRFTDEEIDAQIDKVVETILTNIAKKENQLKQQKDSSGVMSAPENP